MSTNPIASVRATGDPFAIGHALGVASAAALVERVFQTEEYMALDARWRGTDHLAGLEAAARAAFPRYVREIEGIAAGAGQDFETLFLWNCRGDLRLPAGVSAATANLAATGCTSVMIPAAGDAPAVIAHNEDGAAELLGACMWVDVRPEGEPGWKSFMYPGMLPGHTFGLNTSGLVQTINNIRAHDLKVGVPRQLVSRAVLGCRRLDEAIGVLERSDRASGFHHNLGEAGSRRVVSVEAPASGCVARDITAPFAHANHLIFEEFDGLDQTITNSSRARQGGADRMIQDGTLTRLGPEGVLFDTETPIHCDRDGRGDYSQTLSTVVFELHADRVVWRVHATAEPTPTLSGEVPLETGSDR